MEAILFDWDGTLVDTLGAFHVANSTVMKAFDLPFDEAVYRRNYVPDWRQMYLRLGIPVERLEEANALWETTFGSNADLVVAFARVRSVAGGTGNTAVGGPAAAQTVWKRPRSGSMIVRTVRG